MLREIKTACSRLRVFTANRLEISLKSKRNERRTEAHCTNRCHVSLYLIPLQETRESVASLGRK
jgi:hypothetical protein